MGMAPGRCAIFAMMMMLVMLFSTMMMVMMAMTVVHAVPMVGRRRRGSQWRRTMERLRRGDEGASFHPQQPHADQNNERVAQNLDHVDGAAHGGGGRIQ